MEKVYPIRINKTGRYLKYCDEHWYETDSEPTMKYTEAECNRLLKQLKNHYVYDATIEGLEPKVEVKVEAPAQEDFLSFDYLKKFMK